MGFILPIGSFLITPRSFQGIWIIKVICGDNLDADRASHKSKKTFEYIAGWRKTLIISAYVKNITKSLNMDKKAFKEN